MCFVVHKVHYVRKQNKNNWHIQQKNNHTHFDLLDNMCASTHGEFTLHEFFLFLFECRNREASKHES